MQLMVTHEQIASFLRERTSYSRSITEDTDLEKDLGVFGDDMSDLLKAYSERFGVDMSNYLWYFHTGEEGFISIGGLFFRPPYARVDQIPITAAILREFANRGKWDIAYPPHSLPKRRIDLIINTVIVYATLFLLLAGVLWKYVL